MKFGVNTITCSKVIEIFVLGGDDLSPPPGLDRVNKNKAIEVVWTCNPTSKRYTSKNRYIICKGAV